MEMSMDRLGQSIEERNNAIEESLEQLKRTLQTLQAQQEKTEKEPIPGIEQHLDLP